MTERRDFLRLLGSASTAALAACGWDGGPLLRPRLLAVSRFNDWVAQRILYSPTRLAPTYDPRLRSPGLPNYYVSAAMPVLQNPAAWRLRVDGLVRQPLLLSLEELRAMPSVSYTVKPHCVEGWTAFATWQGVPMTAIMERCRPLPGARYLNFQSFDSGYSNGWDLASA